MIVSDISVELIDHCGNDLSVVNAARVSFDKRSSFEALTSSDEENESISYVLSQKDVRLIHYLAEHKHTSPFNHAFVSFRVKAPIFVARQLVKHEYLPWNEISRRYITKEPEFYFPEYWRKASDNVKQGSKDEPVEWLEIDPEYVVAKALRLYEEMIDAGVCAEQARMILPQNTMTEWIWSGTLHAFAKMCKLRLDKHTQRETQKVAELITNKLLTIYPVSFLAIINAK